MPSATEWKYLDQYPGLNAKSCSLTILRQELLPTSNEDCLYPRKAYIVPARSLGATLAEKSRILGIQSMVHKGQVLGYGEWTGHISHGDSLLFLLFFNQTSVSSLFIQHITKLFGFHLMGMHPYTLGFLHSFPSIKESNIICCYSNHKHRGKFRSWDHVAIFHFQGVWNRLRLY